MEHGKQAEKDQEFFPVTHEGEDGVSTLQWVEAQPWCDGNIGMYGQSYLGLTQFAAAGKKATPKALKALVPSISASRVFDVLCPQGALQLDLVSRWLYLVLCIQDKTAPWSGYIWSVGLLSAISQPLRSGQRRLIDYACRLTNLCHVTHRARSHLTMNRQILASYSDLPVEQAPLRLTGKNKPFLDEMMQHFDEPDHPYWREKNLKALCDLSQLPPTHIIGGWYDLFLRESIRDYEDLLRCVVVGMGGCGCACWLARGGAVTCACIACRPNRAHPPGLTWHEKEPTQTASSHPRT